MSGTETIDPRYRGIDTWSDERVLTAFWEGQAHAIQAVRPALPAIASAAKTMAGRLGDNGRLIYAGAGSAGRQAALDGMELGATFSWPAERLVFLLAEGLTLTPGVKSTDEDDTVAASAAVEALKIQSADCLIAVAASGTTPFTVTAAQDAKRGGALIVAISNNPGAPLLGLADHPILLATGPEVISGSTRMNAGTAQKAALGLLSSLLMTHLGHVMDGLMVSMRADCSKLEARAARIVAALAECTPAEAEMALAASGNRIKTAVLVARGRRAAEAEALLANTRGNLRIALQHLDRSP